MNRWHSPPAELYTLVEQSPATVLLECAAPSADSDSLTRLFTAPSRIVAVHEYAQIPSIFAEIGQAVAAGHYAAGFFSYECGNFFEPTAGLHSSVPGEPLAWFGIYQRPWIFDHETGKFLGEPPPALAQLRARDDDPVAEPQIDASFALTEEQYAERIAAIHQWIHSGDVYQLNFTAPFHVRALASSAALYQLLRTRQPVPYGAFLHWQPGRRILSFSPELFFQLQQQGSTRRITTRPMKGTAPRGRTTREDRELAEWLCNDPKNRSENVMIVDLLRNDLGRICKFGAVRAENLFAVERHPTLWQMTSTVTGDLRPDVNFQQIFRALFPCGSITGAPKVRAMQLLAQLESQPRGVYTGAIGFFSKEKTVFNVAIRTLSFDGERGTMGVGSGIVIDSGPAGEFRECLLKAEFLTGPSSHVPKPSPDQFSLVEVLLWNGDYPLIELHLDRFEDSAAYFAFPCDRAAIKAALLAHAATFTHCQPSIIPDNLRAPSCPSERTERVEGPAVPVLAAGVGNRDPQSAGPARKVRLLLNREGDLIIKSEPLPGTTDGIKPLRVRIALERTDPQNPMLFHKTTHRPVYVEALKAAIQAGFDDVLFLNLRGEVTESALHNIVIQKDGYLFTPPVECGLLAGVHRRHLLENRPETKNRGPRGQVFVRGVEDRGPRGQVFVRGVEDWGPRGQVFVRGVEERVLSIHDLRQADVIYLSNAVRGLRPAFIDWPVQVP
ncbi:MAG: aminodeoxychorismate synthase component I [Terracidiphilus sp.]|jgi:para-aminobenzoate synthetase/4-amino-4-deoxychorismate lyase